MITVNSHIYRTAANRLRAGLVATNTLRFFDALYCTAIPERTTQSKAEIINGIYNATETGNPNFFGGYGYYGNGSGSVYLSLLNPTSGGLAYSKDNAHISVYNRDHISQGIELGQYDGTKGSWIASRYSDNLTYLNINGAAGVSFGNLTDTRGWLLGKRSNSTQISLYKNATLVNTLASNSVGIANQPFYALATNQSGSVLATTQSPKKLSLVTVGPAVVSGNDISTYATVINNLFNQFFIDLGFPLRVCYGYGDSVLYGYNATTQDFSHFNLHCQNKHYDWVNGGVSGQAIASGGTQTAFNTANIINKSQSIFNYKTILNWGMNDTFNYADGSRTLPQIQSGIQSTLNAFNAAGWSYANDIIYIGEYQVSNNGSWNTTQYAAVMNLVKTECASRGIPFLSIQNAAAYNHTDGAHPDTNADYKKIADYTISQTGV